MLVLFFFSSDGLKMLQTFDEVHFRVLEQAEAVAKPLIIKFENSEKKKKVPVDWGKTNIVPILLNKQING